MQIHSACDCGGARRIGGVSELGLDDAAALRFHALAGDGSSGALSVAVWVNYARLVRGETLKLRELDYIQAARCNRHP